MNLQQKSSNILNEIIVISQEHKGLLVVLLVIILIFTIAYIFDKLAEKGYNQRFLFWKISIKSHQDHIIGQTRSMNCKETLYYRFLQARKPKLPPEEEVRVESLGVFTGTK